jgi:hypothetical protein
VKTMNDGNEAKLTKKYHHVCFYDDDNEEIRRVVGIEWHTANGARGVRSQYQLTQLLDSVSQEGYEAYAINEVLHEMIAQCPVVHNMHLRIYFLSKKKLLIIMYVVFAACGAAWTAAI